MRGVAAGGHRVLWAGEAELCGLAPQAWEEVAVLAGREGLGGFLYCRCVASGVRLPGWLRSVWQAEHRTTAVRNIVALREVGAALAQLSGRGLDALVMPGAALLPLYPDPGCRPMDDLDLLVRPSQQEQARASLREQGFESPTRYPDLFARGDLLVDLHADLLNASRIRARRRAGWMDLEEVWRDSQPSVVEGVRVQVMSREDMLLYTAVHALRHGFGRLTWFIDLRLLMQTALDWERVAHKAERYGVQRPLAYGLRFLQEQALVEVPAPARELAAKVRLGRGERILLPLVFQERWRGQWGDVLWALNVPGLAHRLRFLAETSFPRPAVMLQVFPNLPRSLLPLAYGLRLGQLVARGSRQLGRMARKAGAVER